MAPIDSMGPFLIGNLLNYGLMGVLAVQVYFYTLAFPNDRLANKALVGVIMGLDIVQTSCATMYIWDIIIVGWGDVARIEHAPWSISTLPPTAGTVAFIAQSFFAWRVWILGTRRWPFVLIVGATLVVWDSRSYHHGNADGSDSTSLVCDVVLLWDRVGDDFSLCKPYVRIERSHGMAGDEYSLRFDDHRYAFCSALDEKAENIPLRQPRGTPWRADGDRDWWLDVRCRHRGARAVPYSTEFVSSHARYHQREDLLELLIGVAQLARPDLQKG